MKNTPKEIEEKFIPNWTMWETDYVQIQLLINNEDSIPYYTAMIFFMYGNGKYNTSIVTHLEGTDKNSIMRDSFIYAASLFPNVHHEVIIIPDEEEYNEDDVKIIDLRKIKFLPNGYTLH